MDCNAVSRTPSMKKRLSYCSRTSRWKTTTWSQPGRSVEMLQDWRRGVERWPISTVSTRKFCPSRFASLHWCCDVSCSCRETGTKKLLTTVLTILSKYTCLSSVSDHFSTGASLNLLSNSIGRHITFFFCLISFFISIYRTKKKNCKKIVFAVIAAYH